MYALLTLLGFVFYLMSAVGYGAALFLSSPAAPTAENGLDSRAKPIARVLLLLGIIIQFAAIGAWCISTHHSPIASETGSLALFAWAIALAVAAFDWRQRLTAVGAVALPVACALLFVSVLKINAPIAETPILRDSMVSMHVLSILASFGLFAVAFGFALLYLLQNNLLRSRTVRPLFRRLPPLSTLDSAAYRSVAIAMPLLTIGLALGLARIFRGGLPEAPAVWLSDPHTLASFCAWLLYSLYLSARLAFGWRGVRLQYILLAGLFCVLALQLVPTTTHHFD